MENEQQVDPEYLRIRNIATSYALADHGALQNIMMQRKEIARMILDAWDNKILWNIFEHLESRIKEYLNFK